jgi:hypothetical protein
MLDFDNIDDWAPKLTAALSQHVPDSVKQKLVGAIPEYEFIEDVQNKFFDLTDRIAIIDATMAWLKMNEIAGYHGSRLTDEEVDSIRINGLIPLEPHARRYRLSRTLSTSPRWPEVLDELDPAILAYGRANRAGLREGQVHLTLSRTSLTQDFNHYLIYGSEFDQHVAQELLGTEGIELLASYGESRVFQVAVPGDLALDAAHPSFTVDDLRDRGEVLNLVKEVLKSWVYRLVCPSFQSKTLKVDCGMVFRQDIPAAWITDINTLNDSFNWNAQSTNNA